MVKVKFYGLIRSNHKIEELHVTEGSIGDIIKRIQITYPKITAHEFDTAVLFINGKKIMHFNKYETFVNTGDTVIFTNFVGGG